MNYSESDLERLDDLLARKMRNGESPEITIEDDDPALRMAANDIQVLWHATRLERLEGKLAMLRSMEQELTLGERAKRSLSSIFRKGRTRWFLSIAAGVCILVAAALWIMQPGGPQKIQNAYLAAHFEGEYVLHSSKRSASGQEYSSAQLEAYNLYAAQRFSVAIPKLEKLWAEERDSLALFYLGVSYVASGKIDISRSYFEPIKHIPRYEMLVEELSE